MEKLKISLADISEEVMMVSKKSVAIRVETPDGKVHEVAFNDVGGFILSIYDEVDEKSTNQLSVVCPISHVMHTTDLLIEQVVKNNPLVALAMVMAGRMK